MGHQVSKKANTCPQCGNVIKKKAKETSLLTLIVLFFALWVGYVALFGSDDSTPTRASKPAFSGTDSSPAAQKKREKLIRNLIDQGIFQKVSMPGSQPRIHVGHEFYTITADDKKLFAGVVLAWYWVDNPKVDMVIFYDAITDRKIGIYSPTLGGLDLD